MGGIIAYGWLHSNCQQTYGDLGRNVRGYQDLDEQKWRSSVDQSLLLVSWTGCSGSSGGKTNGIVTKYVLETAKELLGYMKS